MDISRSLVSKSVSSWVPNNSFKEYYEPLTFTATGTLSVRGNGTDCVSIFKSSGAWDWDAQAYTSVGFTAPVTLEFNKISGNRDNDLSYAMIGWNTDPTANASYNTLDYAAYPYAETLYEVYHNGSYITPPVRNWSRLNKFYLVYDINGMLYHYNGSTLMYSVNYGAGQTVYVDSSFNRVSAVFGGFTNIRVIKKAWNGISY